MRNPTALLTCEECGAVIPPSSLVKWGGKTYHRACLRKLLKELWKTESVDEKIMRVLKERAKRGVVTQKDLYHVCVAVNNSLSWVQWKLRELEKLGKIAIRWQMLVKLLEEEEKKPAPHKKKVEIQAPGRKIVIVG